MLENNYGHWSTFEKVNLDDVLGFVYLMEFESGKKYIGAKKVWKRIARPPSSFKRGPKRGLEQSDWRDYISSNSEIQETFLLGNQEIKNMIIIGWYDSWGKTLFAEAINQIKNRVLSEPDWLNAQIEGHFSGGCDDDKIYQDAERLKSWLDGNYTKPLIGTEIELNIDIVNADDSEILWPAGKSDLIELCRELKITGNQLKRLASGDIDSIEDRLFLNFDNRILNGVVQNVQTKEVHKSFKEAIELYEFADQKELLNDGRFIRIKPETRAEFKSKMVGNLEIA